LQQFITASARLDGHRLSDDERQQPPLVACVDNPATRNSDIATPVCEFRGWVSTASGEPAVVRARIGRSEVRSCTADLPRPDLTEVVPHVCPQCTHAGGFRLYVDVPESRRRLKVVVEFTDGTFLASSPPYRLRYTRGPELVRGNYKRVWNEAASDLDNAKVGVAETTDEGAFDRSAREKLRCSSLRSACIAMMWYSKSAPASVESALSSRRSASAGLALTFPRTCSATCTSDCANMPMSRPSR
jgi:hypothetical protein